MIVAAFTVAVLASGSVAKATLGKLTFSTLIPTFSKTPHTSAIPSLSSLPEPTGDDDDDDDDDRHQRHNDKSLRPQSRYAQCDPRAHTRTTTDQHAPHPESNPAQPLNAASPLRISPPALPTSLSRYVEWHARARACFLSGGRGSECVSVAAGSDGGQGGVPGVLIWRCKSKHACAGIGDRLRGIDALFLLAVLTRRLFFIDVRQGANDHTPLTLAVGPALIDWSLPPTLLDPHRAPAFASLNWHNVHSAHALPAPAFVSASAPNAEGTSALFDPYVDPPQRAFGGRGVVFVSCNVGRNVFSAIRLTPYLATRFAQPSSERSFISLDLDPATLTDLQLARAFAQILYRPSDALAPAVQRALDQIAPAPTAGKARPPFIAVHVRTGAQLGEAHVSRFSKLGDSAQVSWALLSCIHKSVHRCSDAKRSTRACAEMTDENDDGDGDGDSVQKIPRSIFIAGDDFDVKRLVADGAREAGYDRVIVGGAATHVGLPLGLKKPQSNSNGFDDDDGRKACEDLLDVFVDLVVMSHADAVVSTGSGFARSAFVWGNASTLRFAFSTAGSPGCIPMLIR